MPGYSRFPVKSVSELVRYPPLQRRTRVDLRHEAMITCIFSFLKQLLNYCKKITQTSAARRSVAPKDSHFLHQVFCNRSSRDKAYRDDVIKVSLRWHIEVATRLTVSAVVVTAVPAGQRTGAREKSRAVAFWWLDDRKVIRSNKLANNLTMIRSSQLATRKYPLIVCRSVKARISSSAIRGSSRRRLCTDCDLSI